MYAVSCSRTVLYIDELIHRVCACVYVCCGVYKGMHVGTCVCVCVCVCVRARARAVSRY
jgi:hypothetical protein